MLASNYLLPISGLLISVYVGWFWNGTEEKAELIAGGSRPDLRDLALPDPLRLSAGGFRHPILQSP